MSGRELANGFRGLFLNHHNDPNFWDMMFWAAIILGIIWFFTSGKKQQQEIKNDAKQLQEAEGKDPKANQ